jgi:hypothetical protein
LLVYYLPAVAQRRLPKMSAVGMAAQCPRRRWLKWGDWICNLGTVLLMGLGFLGFHKLPRMEEERGGFLLAAIFTILSLSRGILALSTGVYREIVGRGAYGGSYYRVAQTGMSWVPWAQIIAALIIAGVSLVALVASGSR